MGDLRGLFKLALKLSISAACIGYLLYKLDAGALKEAILRADPVAVAVAVASFLALSIVQTWRWLLVARALAITAVSWKTALETILIGMFFNQTLPSSMGGDAVRVWRLRKTGGTLSTVLNSVVIERLFAIIAMVMISILSLPMLIRYRAPEELVYGLMVIDAAAFATFAFVALMDKLPLPAKLRDHNAGLLVLRLAKDLRAVLRTPNALYACLMSLLIHVAVSAVFWVLATGIGLDINPAFCLAFIPVVLLLTALPISIAGWGVRESAVVGFFALVGASPVHSLAASVLFGLAVAAAALPGGAIWLLTKTPAAPAEREIV